MEIKCTPEELKQLIDSNEKANNDAANIVLKTRWGCSKDIDWAVKKFEEIRKQEHNCHCALVIEQS